jgi:MoxR-like ATPase
MIRRVPVADSVVKYAIHLVRASRPHPKSFDFINRWVSWGAGPRASQYLILGAKTRAIMQGRFVPAKEDIQAVAYPVLRHRILTNFQAEAEGITSLEIIKRLLEKVSD